MSEKLRAARRTDFNVNLRLCDSQIMRLKRLHPENLDDATLWHPTTYAIEYAVRSDPACPGLQIALLNEIDRIAVTLTTTTLRGGSTYLQLRFIDTGEAANHWTWTKSQCRISEDFLGFAVQCQLINYVDQILHTISPEQAGREAIRLANLALNHYCVSEDTTDRPTIHHRSPNTELLNLLHRYRVVYAKEEFGEPMPDEVKPQGRLWSCFCFG
jgi:hypothetical protein